MCSENSTNFCLYETLLYIDENEVKHLPEYYLYDIEKDTLTEISFEEYSTYKEENAWSNQVLNKEMIEQMIKYAKDNADKRAAQYIKEV